MEKSTAIILAAGQGKRMNSNVAKQYLMLGEFPVLYYTIKAFEESVIDEIILVVGKDDVEYCKEEIVKRYNFNKVKNVIIGGSERYESVYKALKVIESTKYVLIHDGARPLVTSKMIEECLRELNYCNAVVVAVPVKDTIKLVKDNNIVESTVPRERAWAVQTPQAFSYELIKKAYDILMQEKHISVTDDAMVLEQTLHNPVKLIEGSYQNIKITTQEDLIIAKSFL